MSLLAQDKDYANLLSQLRANQETNDLDEQLAFLLSRFYPSTDLLSLKRFHFLTLWLSVELRTGHVCLDFSQQNYNQIEKRFSETLVEQINLQLASPTRQDWLKLLQNKKKSEQNNLISDGTTLSPLVLDDQRLYFQRLWHNEQIVAHYLKQATQDQLINNQAAIDPNQTQSILDRLFPASSEFDLQKEAVRKALTNQLTIISGGPGTGKTTTVAKILTGLLLAQPDKTLSIGAATPTGKASARLTESLSKAVIQLKSIPEPIKNQLSLNALTLHKLLGAKPNSNQFKYNADNPLPFDIILIDEASMIDLSMMAQLILALKPSTKLILLGDKDQLASVEAGAIFNDMCSIDRDSTESHLLQNSLCFLTKSYRFDEHSGIKKWATLVNQGDVKGTMTLFKTPHSDIFWTDGFKQSNQEESLPLFKQDYADLIAELTQGYLPYFEVVHNPKSTEKEIIQTFDCYRVLVALNTSDFGMKTLNRKIEQRLLDEKLLTESESQIKDNQYYVGQPIMMTKNNPLLNLFNGDIGILFKDKQNHSFYASFLKPDGEVKQVPISLLSDYETAFAMTIHKSQGSEFDQVAIVLPNHHLPLLTRSLLYTAITRAKKKVRLYSSQSVLKQTILTQQQRQSGLAALLSR